MSDHVHGTPEFDQELFERAKARAGTRGGPVKIASLIPYSLEFLADLEEISFMPDTRSRRRRMGDALRNRRDNWRQSLALRICPWLGDGSEWGRTDFVALLGVTIALSGILLAASGRWGLGIADFAAGLVVLAVAAGDDGFA